MDRLAEKVKGQDAAEIMRETRAAAEAIAELAEDARSPEAVIDLARNEASIVSRNAGRAKDSIIAVIETETDPVLTEKVGENLSLDRMYGVDRYLEKDLEEVEIVRSTDKRDDTTFRWKFSDGARIENDDSVHMHRNEFWERLCRETTKPLSPELASEQVGDPDEDEDRYRNLSLGPESRPWHRARKYWVESISSLLEERGTEVEVTGPRSSVWEEVQDKIRQTRAVADRTDAITESQAHVVCEDGEILEVWVPASEINKICEEWDLSPNGLQAELSERGVDSDDVPGNGISEAFIREGRATRFWRLDATHEEVPDPEEVVDELDDGLDRDRAGQGFTYGGEDE
jgi:hypothetical protein